VIYDKKFLLRMDKETHQRLADIAWAERTSMNQWLLDRINEHAVPKMRGTTPRAVVVDEPAWVAVPPPPPDPEINERFAFTDHVQPELDFCSEDASALAEQEPIEVSEENVDIPAVEF